MPESWRFPVAEPLFVDALAQEIITEAKEKGPKPTAYATRLRFSDAGKCARAISYSARGLPGEPFDPASLHVAWVGTKYHEFLQEALAKRFPGCEIEPKGIVDDITNSGHADAVVRGTPLGDVLFELKTKSSYQFDKAIGYFRKAWKSAPPEGPGLEVILQAALNASAHTCTTIVIGYVTFENISINAAEKLGLRHFDRFLAEWHVPKDVWQPLLDQEKERLAHILECVEEGTLPRRLAYDDAGELQELDPLASRPPWQCTYCSFRELCIEDGR